MSVHRRSLNKSLVHPETAPLPRGQGEGPHCGFRCAGVLPEYSGPAPLMVFIDGDHYYEGVKREIEWALHMGVPVICGHDYDEESPDVIRAVDDLHGRSIETPKGFGFASGSRTSGEAGEPRWAR